MPRSSEGEKKSEQIMICIGCREDEETNHKLSLSSLNFEGRFLICSGEGNDAGSELPWLWRGILCADDTCQSRTPFVHATMRSRDHALFCAIRKMIRIRVMACVQFEFAADLLEDADEALSDAGRNSQKCMLMA